MATVMNIIVSGDPEQTYRMKIALQAIIDGDRVEVYDSNFEDDWDFIDDVCLLNTVKVSLINDGRQDGGEHYNGILVFADSPPEDVFRLCCVDVKTRLENAAQYVQMLYDSV